MTKSEHTSSNEAMLRAVILDLLNYPRNVFQSGQDLDCCLHGGFYNEDDKDCELCEQLSKCRWLLSNDDFVDLSKKTTDQLLEALSFARDQISVAALVNNHKNNCKCQICSWLVIADVCLIDAETEH